MVKEFGVRLLQEMLENQDRIGYDKIKESLMQIRYVSCGSSGVIQNRNDR